jgi:hypothetical protein
MNSTNALSGLYWHTQRLECRTMNAFFVSSAFLFQGSPFYDHLDSSVSSSLGHRVLAEVNLKIPHSTSILFTRTNVYGYSSALSVFSMSAEMAQSWVAYGSADWSPSTDLGLITKSVHVGLVVEKGHLYNCSS